MNCEFTNRVSEAIDRIIAGLGSPSIYVIADSNTSALVKPLLAAQSASIAGAPTIDITPGDAHKDIDAVQRVWAWLSASGATRSSLIINLGGGMVTDLGGFAAATFKRGLRFINIPTTLLGAVDAAVGGKTGVNLGGLKNEVGAFAEAEAVIISTRFFDTLPPTELKSGYAEMLKHGLLDGRQTLAELLKYDISSPIADHDALLAMLQKSVGVKAAIVAADPKEAGLRKALNLGHTVGHAFESFAMTDMHSPIPHGYAVAWGLVTELILSHLQLKFPAETLHTVANYVKRTYGFFAVTCDDYPRLLELMSHDKKNASPDRINFTLLSAPGAPVTDCTATPDDIRAALDITRDLLA